MGNPIHVGEIDHKGKRHRGQHETALGLEAEPSTSFEPLAITLDAKLKRSSRARRIVTTDPRASVGRNVDPTLVKALQRANRWWSRLKADPSLSVSALAQSEHVSRTYITDLLALAFLAPPLVNKVVLGEAPQAVDLAKLITKPVALLWRDLKAAINL